MKRASLVKITLFGLVLSAVVSSSSAQSTDAGADARVDQMLAKMTLQQKISLLGGRDMVTVGVPSAGLRPLRMSDGPMGIKGKEPANAMPGGLCLASTWNPALAYDMGKVLGQDARSRGIDILLGPGVNMVRSPMGGRNFEYFSEDPKLAGGMAVGYIRGVQDQGVIATVKHFAANNSEFDRHNTDAIIDERTLHELYLPAFEAAVKQAHVGAVMTSYNLVNGEHASQNHALIHDVLESQWGFDGIVMSDWGSTYDGVAAARAGLGIEMPLGKHMDAATLLPALKDGRLSEADIDDKVRRLLREAVRFQLLDRDAFRPEISRFRPEALDTARSIAEQGIVLLKNQGDVLPLDDSVRKIAVIGPDAWPLVASGGGSSHVGGWTDHSVVEALQVLAGNKVAVYYDRGIPSPEDIFASTTFMFHGAKGLQQEIFETSTFSGPSKTSRAFTLDMATGQRASSQLGKQRSVRWSGQYTAEHAGDYFVFMGTDPHDLCHLYVNDKDVLDAERHEIISPPMWATVALDKGPANVRLECVTKLLAPQAGLGLIAKDEIVRKEARQLAANADAVVVSVGFDNTTEFEGMDRTFALPGGQDELIRAMAGANKRTVVAHTGGGNVDMSRWIDAVPGLLSVWYPGEEGGTALGEILLGKVNPSGKLPVSFEASQEQNPTYKNYYPASGSTQVTYREGVFLGYRYYTSKHVEPRFPFGYGLSYTKFSFSNLHLNKDRGDGQQPVEATVDVRNDGQRSGAEVVQLYVGCSSTKAERPVKELKGFRKVELAAGEKTTVHFTLEQRDFSYYSTEVHAWTTESGRCRVMAGDSSENTPLEAAFEIQK